MGEPEYNVLNGIPYFDTIFTDTPKIDLFQAAIIETLEKTDEIERISNFDYKQDDGVFSYSLIEHTTYGEINLNG